MSLCDSKNGVVFLVRQYRNELCLVLFRWRHASPCVCQAYLGDAAFIGRGTAAWTVWRMNFPFLDTALMFSSPSRCAKKTHGCLRLCRLLVACHDPSLCLRLRVKGTSDEFRVRWFFSSIGSMQHRWFCKAHLGEAASVHRETYG